MLIGSWASVRGQVSGSLPVNGRRPNSVSATPSPSLPGSQAATRPSMAPSWAGSMISGRPETTTHLATCAQTLSTAALSVALSEVAAPGERKRAAAVLEQHLGLGDRAARDLAVLAGSDLVEVATVG